MNHWENMYIQIYRQQNLLITEQQVNEPNPLYELAQLPQAIRDGSQPDIPQTGTSGTHTHIGKFIFCFCRMLHFLHILTNKTMESFF
jgi:hypothetical protein